VSRHRWMAIVPYEVTEEDGLRMVGALPSTPGPPGANLIAGDERPSPDDTRPFLGTHNVAQDLITVGCFACEQPLTRETAGTECPGEPGGKLAYVDATGRDVHPDEAIAQGGNLSPTMRFAGVGRNDPCPCGSGLKFKRCHGQ
jgi:hypothetical protein